MEQDTFLTRILTYFTLLLLLSRLAEAQHSETLILSEEDKQRALDFTKDFTGGKYPVYLYKHVNSTMHDEEIQYTAAFFHSFDFNVTHSEDFISIRYIRDKQQGYLINPLSFNYNFEDAIKQTLRHEMAHAEFEQKTYTNFNRLLKEVNFKFGKHEMLEHGVDMYLSPAYFTRADKENFREALIKDFEFYDNYLAEKDTFIWLEELLIREKYTPSAKFSMIPRAKIEEQPNAKSFLNKFLNKPFSHSPIRFYEDDVLGIPMKLHAIITLKAYPNFIIACSTPKHLADDFLRHMDIIEKLFSLSWQPKKVKTNYIDKLKNNCNSYLQETYFDKMPTLFSQTEKEKMYNNCLDNGISDEVAARILALPATIQRIFFKHTSAYLKNYLNSSSEDETSSTAPSINHNEL